MIAFRVPGLPIAQGSKSFKGLRNGKPVLAESAKGLEPWRRSIELLARRATGYSRPMLDTPVTVLIEFSFPRPKARAGELRHATMPDVDKLARAVLDSLTAAQVLADDGRVSDLVATKRYGDAGAYIVVSTGELDLAAIVKNARATEPLELDAGTAGRKGATPG